jgi:uncharacterized protein YdaU (DUF1376 family)
LENDDEFLMQVCECPERDWALTKARIFRDGYFVLGGDGKWHQKRTREEYDRAKELIERKTSQTEAARRTKHVTKPVTDSVTDSVTRSVTDPVTTPVTETTSPTPTPLPTEAPTAIAYIARDADLECPQCPEMPSWEAVLFEAQRIGLSEWKARDWFDEMEGCGWLDYKGRQVFKWQNILNRLKVKWESDGRPQGPPKAKQTDQGKPSVYSLTKIIEAKKLRCDELKAIHAVETGLGVEWNNEKARAEHKQLRCEIKQLNEQLRNMA